ncbi:MAG: tetratricopeptide repeat protein [bacterium]
MLKIRTIVSILIITLLISLCCHPKKSTIYWFNDADKAKKEAQSSKKPLIIYFRSSSINFCKDMEIELFYDEGILKLSDKYIWLWIDGDIKEEIANYYSVHAYPEMIFYSYTGKELFREIGKIGKEKLIEDLRLVDEGYCRYDEVKVMYDKEPGNLKLKYEYAKVLYEMGKTGEYLTTLNEIIEEDKDNKDGVLTKAELDLGFQKLVSGNVDRAMEHFNTIVEKYPQSEEAPKALNYMGDCYRMLEDTDKAIATYKQVVTKYPNSDIRKEVENKIAKLETFKKTIKAFWE